jgi:hypothetical protein
MSSVPRGESLEVNPLCLVFFVDDTGHETFADPKYPVFGLGGCAMMASHLDIELRAPWRAMKAESFGGPDVPLHASKLREALPSQIAAIAEFFQKGRFQRFASVVHNTATIDGRRTLGRVQPTNELGFRSAWPRATATHSLRTPRPARGPELVARQVPRHKERLVDIRLDDGFYGGGAESIAPHR